MGDLPKAVRQYIEKQRYENTHSVSICIDTLLKWIRDLDYEDETDLNVLEDIQEMKELYNAKADKEVTKVIDMSGLFPQEKTKEKN